MVHSTETFGSQGRVGINIYFYTALPLPHPRDKGVEVGPGGQVDGHDVRGVAVEGLEHSAGLDVP